MRRFLIPLFLFALILVAPLGALSQTTDIDRAIDNDPALSAIVSASPGHEAQIRERLRRASAFGPAALEEEARKVGREFANKMMPQLIPYAPDSAVLAFVQTTALALDQAAAQSGVRCHTFLIGGLGGGEMPDLSPNITGELANSLAQIAAAGADRSSQRMLSEGELGQILDLVVTRTFEIAGKNPVNFDALANLQAIRDDETKTQACWTTIYFYRAILDLPPTDAAALFRTLMGSA